MIWFVSNPGDRRRAKEKAGNKAAPHQKDVFWKRQAVHWWMRPNCANDKEIFLGDVRDMGNGVNLGKRTNQKISLWPHGKLVNTIKTKSKTPVKKVQFCE
jgi:transposase